MRFLIFFFILNGNFQFVLNKMLQILYQVKWNQLTDATFNIRVCAALHAKEGSARRRSLSSAHSALSRGLY